MRQRLAICLLCQGFLRSPPFGDINTNTGHKAPTGGVGHGKFEDQPVMQRAVRGGNGFYDLLRPARHQDFHIVFVGGLCSALREPVETGFAAKKSQLLPEHPFEGLVHVHVAPLSVFHERDRRTIVHEVMKELLALA